LIGEEITLKKTYLLAFIISLILISCSWPLKAHLSAIAPSSEAARPVKTVKIYFRAEEYYWSNGTYTIWPANTSAPTGDALKWTFTCTAYHEYDGMDVWTGGVAWVTEPFLGDFYVSGDVCILVWLNGTAPGGGGAPAGLIAYVADIDETNNITAYWESDVQLLFGGLPPEPTAFSFSIHVDGHTFVANHRIGFGVVVGSTTYGYMASASFGGQPYLAKASVPTTDYARLASLAVRGPDGQNRTKFYVDEAPIRFEISVSDPFSNLDVAEVRVLIYNSTHVLLNRTAEAITDRRALTTRYALSWYPSGVAPGEYMTDVSVVDNSGNRDVRTMELKMVFLEVSNISWTPRWFKKGLDEQELCLSFSNGGNDVMYDAVLYVVNSSDISLNPTNASLGHIGPGEERSLNLTVSIPAEAELGTKVLLFKIEYSDFRGVGHEENFTISVQVAVMGSSLFLTLEPEEARVLDMVNASVRLLDELGRPLAGVEIGIYVDDLLITSVITDVNGTGDASFQASFGPGLHIVKAVFPGTLLFGPSSAEAQLRIRLRNSSLEARGPSEALSGALLKIECFLKGEDDEPIENATILLYILKDGSPELLAENRTDADGMTTFSITLETGEHELRLVFGGDDIYAGSEAILSITVRPAEEHSPGGAQGMGDTVVSALAVGAALSASAALALWLRRRR